MGFGSLSSQILNEISSIKNDGLSAGVQALKDLIGQTEEEEVMAPPDPVIETQKSVAVTEAEKKKKRAEMMRKRMNAKLKKKQTKISKTLELEESTSESFVTTEEISNCIQCQEELNPDEWIKHPYGQIGEINQT